MKTARSIFLSVITASLVVASKAQVIDVRKTAENVITYQTNQAINTAINTGVNAGVNAIFQAPGKIYRKIKENKQQQQNNQTYSASTGQVYSDPGNNSNYSGNNTNYSSGSSNYSTGNNSSNNYNSSPPVINNLNTIYGTDFTSGNTIVWTEDFSSSIIGKFPATWNSTSNGEVRTLDQTRWLQLSSSGVFAPKNIGNLPQNFALEFDAIFNAATSRDAHYLVYLYAKKDDASDFKTTDYPGNGGIYIAFNPLAGEADAESFENGKAGNLDFHLVTDALKASLTNQLHIAIKKENTKVSLYLNGHEVFSANNSVSSALNLDMIKFGSFYMTNDDFMLISNLKVTSN